MDDAERVDDFEVKVKSYLWMKKRKKKTKETAIEKHERVMVGMIEVG